MIKSRLLKQLSKSSYYVLWQILLKWTGLIGQIFVIFAAARMLTSGQANSLIKLIAGIVIQVVSLVLYNQASFLASARVKEVLREKIYAKLLRLGNHNPVTPAELTQLTSDGIESVDSYFSRYLSQFAYALLAPITLFAILVKISAPASITLLCLVPLIPIVIMVVMVIAKKILNRYFAIYYHLGDTFLEKMQGMTTLKLYQADQKAEDDLARESEHFRQITMKVLTMQLLSTVIMDLVAYGGASAGILVALRELALGQISKEGTLIIIFLSASYFLPMRQLGAYFHIGMNGMKASDQIFAFLDLPEGKKGQEHLGQDLTLSAKNLTFAYQDSGSPAIQDLSLTLPHPGFYALAGRSGSGKSTLAQLLANRLPSSQVKLGGIPLPEIDPSDLTAAITSVSESFAGSIRDNLLAAKMASDDELIDVLSRVQLWNFLQKRAGLDTVLTTNAANLSGGQRQRLAIARALLKDSQIYIFDEATSNVDLETEADIMTIFQELAKAKTVILITHRLANAALCDRIFFLEKGQITESGTQDELIQKAGAYAQLYQQQAALESYAQLGGKNENEKD